MGVREGMYADLGCLLACLVGWFVGWFATWSVCPLSPRGTPAMQYQTPGPACVSPGSAIRDKGAFALSQAFVLNSTLQVLDVSGAPHPPSRSTTTSQF